MGQDRHANGRLSRAGQQVSLSRLEVNAEVPRHPAWYRNGETVIERSKENWPPSGRLSAKSFR
jgi:hypothetical protein